MALLQYDFAVTGQEIVFRALAGIEARFVATARAIERTAAQTGRSVGGTGGKAGPGTLARGGVTHERNAIVAAEKSAARIAEAERRAMARSKVAEDRHWQQLHTKSADYRIKEQLRTERVAERKLQSEAHAQMRRQQQFRKTIFGAAGSGVVSGLGAVGSAVGLGVGLVGGIAAADAIQKKMKAEVNATVLANMAMGTDATRGMSRSQVVSMIQRSAEIEGTRTGMGKGPMLEFLRAVQVKSGDIKGGVALMSHAADLAQGQGAEMGDVGGMAGMVLSTLGKDPSIKDPADMTRKVLDQLFAQSKAGAIDPKLLPQLVGPMLGAARGFGGGDLIKNLGEVGAMMQLSTGTEAGGDPGVAMHALKTMKAEIIEKAKNSKAILSKYGIDPFEYGIGPNGKKVAVGLKEGPIETMASFISATGGDIRPWGEVFGKRGMMMAEPLRKAYMDASTAAGGGAAGAAAGRAGLHEALRKSGLGAQFEEGEVGAAATAVRTTDQGKLDVAMNKLEETLGSALLPVVEKLIPKLEKLTPSIGKLADAVASVATFFIANPFSGIGILVGGYIVKEIAAAAIGEKWASAVKSIAAGTNPVMGAGGGKGRPAGLIGTGVLALIASGFAIKNEYGRQSDINSQADADIAAKGAVSDVTKARAIRSMNENASPIIPIARMLGLVEDPSMLKGGFASGLAGKLPGGQGQKVEGGKELQAAAAALNAAAAALVAAGGNLGGGALFGMLPSLTRPSTSPTTNR
jgi:hypothetical protein